MPITRSAKKAFRQSLKRKARNIIYKDRIKKLLKKVKKLGDLGEKEEIKKLLPQIYKILDKAAKVGVIKEGAAARKKSRVMRLITKIKRGSKSEE